MVKFSIIVPVYNAEKYIEHCIRSIINQNYRDLELILINDGSQDNSECICKKMAEEDRRIIYKSQVNQGPSIARQAGLALATGDYVAFVDADDSLEEGLFTDVVSLCNQGIDIIEYGYFSVWEDNKVMHKLQRDQQAGINCLKHYIYQKNTTNYLWNKIFKKILFDHVDFPVMYLSEDQCILTQLFYYAQRTCTVENAYYNYYSTPSSLCNSPFTQRTMDVLKANDYIYEFLVEKKVEFAAVQSIMGVNSAILAYNKLELTYHGDDRLEYKKKIKDNYRRWLHMCLSNGLHRTVSTKQRLKWLLFKISPTSTTLLRKKIGMRPI